MRHYLYPHELRHIEKSLEVLRNDGVILHPTDSIWGLAGRISQIAHQKIIAIKGRPPDKPFIIGVSSEAMLKEYMVGITEKIIDTIKRTSRPTTIIGNARNLPQWAIATDGTVAIRIMKHLFSKTLIELLGEPIFTTSPNKSGMPTPSTFREIDPKIKEQVDYIAYIHEETLRSGRPSRILKITEDGYTVIRP